MRIKKATIVLICVLALILGGNLSVYPAQAAHVACGDLVTGYSKLDSDLTCLAGSGLIIGANGVTVNLNGHTITGDPSVPASYGIDNTAGFDNIVIKGGTIVGFEQGIRAVGTDNFSVKDMSFTGQTSSHAIDVLDSEDVSIKNSVFALPAWSFGGPEAVRLESVDGADVKNVEVTGGFIGVNFACGVCDGTELPTTGKVKNSSFEENFIGVEIANSTDAYVKSNLIEKAAYAGIEIDFVSNVGTKISHNEIFDSGGFVGYGIVVSEPTTGLEISKNNIHDNAADGAKLDDVDDSKIAKNTVTDNGAHGIALASDSTGNDIEKNTTLGNGVFDLMHDVSSSPNTWRKNTCGTKLGADIPPC